MTCFRDRRSIYLTFRCRRFAHAFCKGDKNNASVRDIFCSVFYIIFCRIFYHSLSGTVSVAQKQQLAETDRASYGSRKADESLSLSFGYGRGDADGQLYRIIMSRFRWKAGTEWNFPSAEATTDSLQRETSEN